MSEGFLVARADWEADRSAIRRIREQVFVHELQVPAELEWDGLDADCVHLLAYDMDGRAIATARMQANGHIGRMAVLAEWRGQGVGSALLLTLLELAGEHGLEEVFLNAQTQAAPFYHRHGFIAEAEPFEEAGIPHLRMSRFCADPAATSALGE